MKHVVPVALALALTACMPAGMAPPGFVGPDGFAGSALATDVGAAIPVDAYTYSIASDATGSRVAFATPAGVFVASAGGEPRQLAGVAGPVGELAWSADDRHLLYTEREIPAAPCVPGSICTASSADEIYAVRRLAVADRAVATVAEHVAGPHGLAAAQAGGRMAYLSQAPGLAVVDVAAGTARTLAGEQRVKAFRWAPDGGAIALLAPDPGTGDPARTRAVHRVDVAGQVSAIGAVPASFSTDPVGPFWTPDGAAVRFLEGRTQRRIPLLTLPAAGGEPRTSDIALNEPGFADYRVSPDGKWVFATRMAGLRERVATVRIALDDGTVHEAGPAGDFWGWAGAGPRWLARIGKSSVQRYYVVTPG